MMTNTLVAPFRALTLGLLAACAAASVATGETSQATLKSRARVTQTEAERTALAKVPGGSIKDAELEEEGGRLVWSFDVATPRSRNLTEVQVDAISGKVVSTEIETPADEAKEQEHGEGAKR